MDWHEHIALRAALEWQMEAGISEALAETPLDRYAEAKRAEDAEKAALVVAQKPSAARTDRPPLTSHPAPSLATAQPDAVSEAQDAADQAADLAELKEALARFEHCELKKGARNLVFSDGVPGARVMIIGEAPGRDEDREGRPFVGRAGQLLDKMLTAIDLTRTPEVQNNARPETRSDAVYITNVLPWRPPQNRDPKPDEIAMMRPFMARHVALAKPDLVLLMGNISCEAGLRKRGITRLRGTWTEAYGVPAMPTFHPAYLLRNPAAKRAAWADLLTVKARLEGRA